MAKYFNYFPKTFYTNSDRGGGGVDAVTNIISRFSFEKSFKDNAVVYYKYDIQDGDTPEIIASKFYNSPERHWIVLLMNEIIDPQFDWPLDQRTLSRYIDSKYSSSDYADTANTSVSGLTWAKNASHIQSYFKVVTRTSTDGTKIEEKLSVDANTYANVVASTATYTLNNASSITQTIAKQTQTYYEYEVEVNESKRSIKLLKPEFLNAIEDELKVALSK